MRVMLEVAADQNDLAGGVLHMEDILKAGGTSVPASAWLDLTGFTRSCARPEVHPLTSDAILQDAPADPSRPPPSRRPMSTRSTLLAETYRDLGRKHDALKTLQQASCAGASNVDISCRCAELEPISAQKDDAIKDYEKAYALNPDLTGLREMLAVSISTTNASTTRRAFRGGAGRFAARPRPGDRPRHRLRGERISTDKAQACFQAGLQLHHLPAGRLPEARGFPARAQGIEAGRARLSPPRKHAFPQSAWVRFYQAIQHRYEKNYDAALACLAQVRALATGSEADVLDHRLIISKAR